MGEIRMDLRLVVMIPEFGLKINGLIQPASEGGKNAAEAEKGEKAEGNSYAFQKEGIIFRRNLNFPDRNGEGDHYDSHAEHHPHGPHRSERILSRWLGAQC